MTNKYAFKLYLTNTTTVGKAKVESLEKVLKKTGIDYSLEVINVLEDPVVAIEDGVVATPTLVKVTPLPKKKVIGQLENAEKLLAELDIVGG